MRCAYMLPSAVDNGANAPPEYMAITASATRQCAPLTASSWLVGMPEWPGRRFGDKQTWAMRRAKHRWVRRQFARLGTVSQCRLEAVEVRFKGKLRSPWHAGVSSSVRMHEEGSSADPWNRWDGR
jgi:hypothetical protein